MQNVFHIETAFAGVITDAPEVTSILANVLQFVLSIVGILGIIGLVVSGIVYLTALGNEERLKRAKTMALASVTGIIVAVGALIIVTQLTAFFS